MGIAISEIKKHDSRQLSYLLAVAVYVRWHTKLGLNY